MSVYVLKLTFYDLFCKVPFDLLKAWRRVIMQYLKKLPTLVKIEACSNSNQELLSYNNINKIYFNF